MRFDLLHFLLFVAAIAAVLASFQLHLFLAMAVCPFVFGPLVAHSFAPTRSAVLAGLFSAIFWTILFGVFAVGFYVLKTASFYPHLIHDGDPNILIAIITLAVSVLTSVIGGYIGARVAQH